MSGTFRPEEGWRVGKEPLIKPLMANVLKE